MTIRQSKTKTWMLGGHVQGYEKRGVVMLTEANVNKCGQQSTGWGNAHHHSVNDRGGVKEQCVTVWLMAVFSLLMNQSLWVLFLVFEI